MRRWRDQKKRVLTFSLNDHAGDANGGISGHLNRSESPPGEALFAKFGCSIYMTLSSDAYQFRRKEVYLVEGHLLLLAFRLVTKIS